MTDSVSGTPRLAAPKVPSGKIAVQAPPEMAPADGISTLLSSMVPMLGGVGAVVMVTMSGTGITGILTGGMFLLSSVGFVAVNGWRQRAQRMSGILSARREYLVYLAELRKTVRTAAKQQRRAAAILDSARERAHCQGLPHQLGKGPGPIFVGEKHGSGFLRSARFGTATAFAKRSLIQRGIKPLTLDEAGVRSVIEVGDPAVPPGIGALVRVANAHQPCKACVGLTALLAHSYLRDAFLIRQVRQLLLVASTE